MFHVTNSGVYEGNDVLKVTHSSGCSDIKSFNTMEEAVSYYISLTKKIKTPKAKKPLSTPDAIVVNVDSNNSIYKVTDAQGDETSVKIDVPKYIKITPIAIFYCLNRYILSMEGNIVVYVDNSSFLDMVNNIDRWTSCSSNVKVLKMFSMVKTKLEEGTLIFREKK